MTTTVAATNQSTRSYSAGSLRLVAVCFFLSGTTGLIYEVLWARMLGLVFGATTLAVSTVLAAFMGGLALGSALAGRLGEKLKRPIRAYGLLEIGIAVYAVAVPWIAGMIDKLYVVVWQQFHPGFFTFSIWRFGFSCLMLLVPTTMMGATLPVVSSALVRVPDFRATAVARFYTLNLAGAICGTIAAGFFLLPTFGVRRTIYAAAAINIIIGTIAILARVHARSSIDEVETLDRQEVETVQHETEKRKPLDFQVANGGTKFWFFCAFISGFVTISTQVAWTRVLTMIIGSSTYAFSIVVALFLLGLAGGAYLVARKDYSGKLQITITKIEVVTALSLFLSLFVVNMIPNLLIRLGLGLNIASWSGLLALQISSASLLILVPALLMGTIMPLVLEWATTRSAHDSVRLVGRSYAMNTIGAIAGAFCAGFVFIPKLSTKFTILFAAALCLIVAGVAYRPSHQGRDPDLRRAVVTGVTTLSIVMLFLLAPRMNLADLSIGAYDSLIRVLAKSREGVSETENTPKGSETHELLMYEEGPTSTVSVRKDWDVTSMAINGRTNASDRQDMPTQVMLGQLPLLIAPAIHNALVVGFASGVTVGAMLQSPLETLDCVELEPATINGSRFFEHVNNRPLNDPRVRLVIDDARSYMRVTPNRYDIIVSEPSHPWVPGVANLFTEEFFKLGNDRLTDTGVFVQWLQIYQLSTDSLRSVLRTFHKVFPHVVVFRVGGATKGKDLILIGSKTPLMLDRLAARLNDSRISAELARVDIKSETDVRAWYVCDESQLGPAVGDAVINTDDNMHIETTVPREAFQPSMQTNAKWIENLAAK